MVKKWLLGVVFCVAFGQLVQAAPNCERGYVCGHALAMHGEKPLYGAEATHLAWVNADAPKGGLVKLVANGTFDSVNPFILKGTPAEGIGEVYDTLTGHSNDEAFTVYGLVAERLDLAEDNSHIIFRLRKDARFHDGVAIEAEDVVFSFGKLIAQGLPYYRSYYADVLSVTALDAHSVRFDFATTDNVELPLILGQLPVLPKHDFVEGGGTREFGKTSLVAPLGSGPYRVAGLDAGKWIRYERVEDYWAKDHFLNKGRYNVAVQHYDYYRDQTVAFEAFKAGDLDLRAEHISKNWATGYELEALETGEMKRERVANNNPTGMQAFVMNLRRDKFADERVRQALGLAFDFEWTNKNIFFDAYSRTESFYSNSEFASVGLPSEAELALLEPLRGQVPEAVFTEVFAAPRSDGAGGMRANLKRAAGLFKDAGYDVVDGKLLHRETGQNLTIEFLLSSVTYERLVAPYIRNLQRLGVDARIRTTDPAQYIGRLEQHDFDVIIHSFGQSLSPGNEQVEYWHSSRAEQSGARNLAGVADGAVDVLVDAIVRADSRAALVAACRALDRVLLQHHYVIPQYHVRYYRRAFWNRFGRPETRPKYAYGFESWWVDEGLAGELEARLGR